MKNPFRNELSLFPPLWNAEGTFSAEGAFVFVGVLSIVAGNAHFHAEPGRIETAILCNTRAVLLGEYRDLGRTKTS